MGNLCGKEESASAAPPGRVLGSAPASSKNTQTPAKAKNPRKPKVTGPGRTLGSGSSPTGTSATVGGDGEQPQSVLTDPRTAARLAAEVRIIPLTREFFYQPQVSKRDTYISWVFFRQKRNNAQKGGKLGAQLNQDKRKTQNQHIQDLAKSKGQQERLVWD